MNTSDCFYLLEWPAELVFGGTHTIAQGQPETIKEEPLLEQGWRSRAFSTVGFPDRDRPALPVPQESPRQAREHHFGRSPRPVMRYPSNPLGFEAPAQLEFTQRVTKPNTAAIFSQFNQGEPTTTNPCLEGLKTFIEADQIPLRPDVERYWAGAGWALGLIAQASVGFQVPGSLLPTLKVAGAVQVLLGHAVSVEAVISACEVEFQPKYHQLQIRTVDRLQSLTRKIERWSDAARFPVFDLEGKIDTALTLANTATALTAIAQLHYTASGLQSYKEGAEAVLDEIDSLRGETNANYSHD